MATTAGSYALRESRKRKYMQPMLIPRGGHLQSECRSSRTLSLFASSEKQEQSVCPATFLPVPFVFSPAFTSSLPVIGKANLTELASYKSLKAQDGWSAVGGQTINVYNPKASPGNSSAGNGVSVAAGLCPASIATETGWYYSHLFTSSFPSMLTYYD
jgi:hypothetical protein